MLIQASVFLLCCVTHLGGQVGERLVAALELRGSRLIAPVPLRPLLLLQRARRDCQRAQALPAAPMLSPFMQTNSA